MKSARFQKIISVVLALMLATAVFPPAAFAADRGNVTFMNRTWDSESETVNSAETTLAEPLRSFPGQLAGGGWYYIDEDLTCNDRVTVPAGATVNLILADGVTLTCKNGIYVAATATLNIYGQSEDSGLLKATGSSGKAGIGGNENGNHGAINIYGGTVDATGGFHAAGIGTGKDAEGACGYLCIYGGNVTAHGGEYGAGIGGGDESTGPQMEIYGGEIDATGGDKGAGIGGGCDRGAASSIIWGGTVYAQGGMYAAGIGEGYDASFDSSDGLIVIRNCELIRATGGNMAAGIGGGYYNNTEITIYIFGGKKIIAYGGSNNDTGAAGIGSGSFKEISAMHGEGGDFGGLIYISGGEVHAYGSGTYATFTGTNSGAAGLGAGYGGNMTGIVEISGGTVDARGAYGGAAIGAGAEDFAGYGGECEGRISITGGELELSFLNNNEGDKAVLIGHGCDGETNGTLTLGKDLCVTVGAYNTVATVDRENTLRTYTGALPVFVLECEHENATYTDKDTQVHTVKCQNCKYTGEELHIFYNGPCVCGAEGYGVFFYNCGELCDARMSYGHGGTVEPPEDPVREGLIFDGWYLYGESGDEPYDFSEPINEDVFLEARWLVNVDAAAYDRTTQSFGVGGFVSFGGQEFVTSGTVRMDEDESVYLYARADDGYDFVGWAYRSSPDNVIAASNVLGLSATTNTRLCAVFEEHVHTLRHYDSEAPECEWDGCTEYWYCTKCGKYFDSEDCTHEIGEDDMIIPATGHDWSAEWAWAKDFSSATATLTCSRCTAEETLDAQITVDETTGVYTAAVLYDGETFTDTKTVVTLTFDMGGKCDDYVVKAESGDRMALYCVAAMQAAKAEGFTAAGFAPLPPGKL